MKKILALAAIVFCMAFLYNCSGPQKTASTSTTTEAAKPTYTYEANVKDVVAANCSPCHFPAKGGNKEAFDNPANVKSHIDDMIRRIELNPTDKGFMPFKKAKLSDSTIAIFKQWRQDGMP